MVQDGKPLQEYPVNVVVSRFQSWSLPFFFNINDFQDDVICNITIYVNDTIYSKCDQASDLLQELELLLKLNLTYKFGRK